MTREWTFRLVKTLYGFAMTMFRIDDGQQMSAGLI